MSRVDDLQKRYPSIPRDIILMWDVMVQGVRASDGLDKASDWRPATSGVYQSHDYDGSLRDLADKEPWRVKPGLMFRPPERMYFKTGSGAQIRLHSVSPYEVREVSEGKFALCEGEERVEDIYFVRRKPRTAPEPVTSRGTPISALIEFRNHCFSISLNRYCQFFSTGDQCRFCNYNATQEDVRSVGLSVHTTSNLEETVEAYKIRSSEVEHVEGFLIMGGFAKAEQEAKVFLGFVEKLATAASHKPSLGIHSSALGRKDIQRLRDAGLDTMNIHIEVMDPQLFAEICPGKAKRTPYEGWIQAFYDAVDVLGPGYVGAKIVPGVTLPAPNGHRTWQEARDNHIKANTWLIKNGVLPAFLPLWWAPGSVYAEDRQNLEKFAPTEYYSEVGLAHHEAMLKCGLYQKMSKFVFCGLCCSTGQYAGDIGIIESAGDFGNWMADVVPDESNWLAKFIASLKSPA